MKSIISLAHRPRTFSALVGQQSITSAIEKQLKSGRGPRAWMFSGQTGGGKTTIARILALSYQCSHQPFGKPCKDCYTRRMDFSIHELNASKVNGVQEIGELVANSEYTPIPPSRKRVYILDEAQRLTVHAQNLLLKPFEDPPKTTIWIICTTEPTKILPTLRRRCMQYVMRPLSYQAIDTLVNKIVTKENLKVDVDAFIEAANKAQVSSPALIVMGLEKYASGISAKAAIQGQESNADTLAICRAVVKGNLDALHREMNKTTQEDVRVVRASVAGYLQAIFLKSTSRNELCTMAIEDLAETTKVDESMQMAYLNAVLHEACYQFGKKGS